MGENEGPSWDYDWKPIPLMPLLPVLLFVLILGKGIVKQKESWLVILPVLVLHIFLIPLGYLLGTGFSYNLSGLCFGLAGLLLILERIDHENPSTRFILAWAFVLIFGFLGAVTFPSGSAWEGIKTFFKYSLVSLVMLGSVVLAMRFCRKRFTEAVFLAWLLVSCMILSVIYLFGSTFFNLFTIAFNPIMLIALPVSVFISIFMGFGIFIFILPFMLLCLRNKIYRLKFFGIFRS